MAASPNPKMANSIFSLPFTTLDVFTSSRYTGNPLAVVSVPPAHRHLPQVTKQVIAREFNLSETVFLHQPTDAASTSREIDIFTPNAELPFAGHPTIGTATLLLREAGLGHVTALITKAGEIGIARTDGGVRAAIPHDVHVHAGTLGGLQKDFVARIVTSADAGIREAELKAPVVSIVKGMTFVLVELESLEQLATVGTEGVADLNGFQELGLLGLLDKGPWGKGFTSRYHYVRMEDGSIRTRNAEHPYEDPATGSAACTLTSYLTLKRRSAEGGPIKYNIIQGVEMGRESHISVEVVPETDGEGKVAIKELYLGGTAVVVMNGTIAV